MKLTRKIQQSGDNVSINLPAEVVKELKIKKGNLMAVDIENESVILKKVNK